MEKWKWLGPILTHALDIAFLLISDISAWIGTFFCLHAQSLKCAHCHHQRISHEVGIYGYLLPSQVLRNFVLKL